MTELLTTLYPWIKAFHIVAVVAWMAGLLYLPRLFVYHAEAPVGSAQSETFKVMERRLLRAIMNPAMIAVWILGGLLIASPPSGGFAQGWLHAKLALVVALTGLHHLFGRWRKDFERDANRHSARTYRIANEVPTVILIAIVILVVVKPF